MILRGQSMIFLTISRRGWTCAAIALLMFSEFQQTISGQEWTRFRGPGGAGAVEKTDLPAQIKDSDIQWKIALPGKGHSSPVLWGDRIFLQSGEPETAKRHLLCVSAKNGQVLWQREYPSGVSKLHGRNSYGTSTPAVDDERVYFTWASPTSLMLVALNHDGEEVWTRDLGPHKSEHGYGVSPIVYQELLVMPNFQLGEKLAPGEAPGVSSVIAVDRKTGKDVWNTPRKSLSVTYSAPCPIESPNGKAEIIITSNAHGIFSLDPKSGNENWALEVFRLRPVSSPFVAGGLLFCTAGEGANGHLVAVKPGPNPKVVYESKTKMPYVPTPIASDSSLFVWSDVGIISCLDIATGDVQWTSRLKASGNLNFSSSPVRAGDQIYNLTDEGRMLCIKASKSGLEMLGEYDFGEECRATPALAHGKMFVRTVSHLICIGK
jgi:outer membrane protein assembly factor BamB